MAVSKIEVNTNTLRSDVERVRTELKGLKDDMRKLSEDTKIRQKSGTGRTNNFLVIHQPHRTKT